MRILPAFIIAALALVSTGAAADEFFQARCQHPNHHAEWHGPRRDESRSRLAMRDAAEHNRHHRGHGARVAHDDDQE
jgi:hypothetical protein